MPDASPYAALLGAGLGPEERVREALARLENDFRRLALTALDDFRSLDEPARELFPAIATLQQPSWGCYNGLLLGLRRVRRRLAAAGRERAPGHWTRVIERLDRRLPAAHNDTLRALCKLCRTPSQKLRARTALLLPISLRNTISHDSPTDPAWWEAAAAALDPLLAWLAEARLFEELLEKHEECPPWVFSASGERWVFNGLTHDFAVRYLVEGPGGLRPELSAERGHAVLLALEALLGRSAEQERGLKKVLAALAPDDIKGVMLGSFLVGPPVGEGGFATVHRGRELATGRQVAVKILRDGMDAGVQDRFQQEAVLLSRFNHPHIVSVLGYGEETWRPPRTISLSGEPWYELFARSAPVKLFIALEWLGGETLDQVFDRPERPAIETLARWFLEATRALRAVHALGLLHRDVKPANLMLDRDGQLKLMDFGIARSVAEQRTIVTQTGQMFGTEAYMAPESLRAAQSEIEVGPRSDIYALCATFYELFSGRRLFDHQTNSAAEVRTRKLAGLRPPHPREAVRGLPWELGTILMGGLEPEPADRYASCAALERDLEAWFARRPIAYRRPSLLRRTLLAYRRNAGLWQLAAAALLVLALVSGLFLKARADAWQELLGERHIALAELETALADPELAAELEATAAQLADYDQRSARGRLHLRTVERADNAARILRLIAHCRRGQRLLSLAREPVGGTPVALLSAPEEAARQAALLTAQRRVFRLAVHNASFTLAALVLGEMRLEDDERAALDDLLSAERKALTRWQCERTREALEDLRAGRDRPGRESWAPTPEEYLIEISGFRRAEVVDVLVAALLPHVAKAREESAPGAPRLWTAAEREELELILRALGHIDLPALAVPALARLMAVVEDHRLAVICGEALCTTAAPAADPVLIAARDRLGENNDAWHQIARVFRRIPIDLETPLTTAEELLARGDLRRDKLDPVGAIADYGRAIELAPDDPRAWDRRGALRLGAGELEAARADFDQALALDPDLASALSGRAGVWQGLDRPDLALRDYGDALEADPEDPLIWSNRGVLRARLGRYQEAIRDYSTSIRLDPSSGFCFSNRGCAWLELGELDHALADFDRALALDPGFAPAWFNRANTWLRKYDPARALPDYDRAVALDPDNPDVYLGRSSALLSLQRTEEGLRDLARVIALREGDPIPYYVRAEALVHAQRWHDAIDDYDRAEAMGLTAPLLYLGRAASLHAVGDRGRALADFSRCIELDPYAAEAYSGLAAVLTELGQLEDARAVLDRGLSLLPDDFPLLFRRGNVHYQRGDYEASYRDYVAGRALRPKHQTVLYNLACLACLLAERDPTEREAWLTAAERYLGEAVDAGFRDREQARTQPQLEGLRGRAEFERLLGRMR